MTKRSKKTANENEQGQEKKELRWGYSTGACATALALSAWHYKQSQEEIHQVEVFFLDGRKIYLPLLVDDVASESSSSELKSSELKSLELKSSHELGDTLSVKAEKGVASQNPVVRIRKDGGDDPDCTHGAILFASLEEAKLSDAMPADYILSVGYDTLIVHAVSGIGLCTRLGLDCEQGHWAINQGPKQMLITNLKDAGMGLCSQEPKVWLFSLGVEDGVEIAKHTLNPHLGVEGGISILGTTGHVRPYSHDAYIETVRVCVRSNNLTGGEHMVFCTGGRTQKAARAFYPTLPDTAFVSIGDFIGESIKAARKYKMKRVTISCMGGKLCKYAAGFENTHAHNVAQDMELLREQILLALNIPHSKATSGAVLHENLDKKTDSTDEELKGCDTQALKTYDDLCAELQKAQSVREALLYIPPDIRLLVLSELAEKAFHFFHSLCDDVEFGILLCDFNGDCIFEKRSPARQTKEKGTA